MKNSTFPSSLKSKLQHYVKLGTGALLLIASLYFIINASHFFSMKEEDLGKYFTVKWLLLLHISAGSAALLTGPFQFWDRLRMKVQGLHRALGKIYVFSVWISSFCAVFLSFTTAYEVSGAYAFSLQVWVFVWIICTTLGYTNARQKKFKLHQEWMTRSYLVTLAFVISALLLKLPVIAQLGTFSEVSPGLFWFSWAVPLFAYDCYLSSVRKQ